MKRWRWWRWEQRCYNSNGWWGWWMTSFFLSFHQYLECFVKIDPNNNGKRGRRENRVVKLKAPIPKHRWYLNEAHHNIDHCTAYHSQETEANFIGKVSNVIWTSGDWTMCGGTLWSRCKWQGNLILTTARIMWWWWFDRRRGDLFETCVVVAVISANHIEMSNYKPIVSNLMNSWWWRRWCWWWGGLMAMNESPYQFHHLDILSLNPNYSIHTNLLSGH